MPDRGPANLSKSRTVRGSSVAALAGSGMTVDAAVDALGEVQSGLEQISVGNVVSILIGLVIVAGAATAVRLQVREAASHDACRRMRGDRSALRSHLS